MVNQWANLIWVRRLDAWFCSLDEGCQSHTRFANWRWPMKLYMISVVLLTDTRVIRGLPIDGDQRKTDKNWTDQYLVVSSKPIKVGLLIEHSRNWPIGQHWWAVNAATMCWLSVSLMWWYEGISKSFEPNMERARNLDLFCFIFQRSPLPTPHTCPI